MKWWAAPVFLIFAIGGIAQSGLPFPGGVRGMGMGGAGLGFQGVYSSFSNPAGLASVQQFAAMAGAESRFLTREIRSLAAAAVLPVAGGALGATVHYYGFEAYNEQHFGLAYARRLSPELSLGGQFLYLQTNIPDYGSRGWLTFAVGLQALVLPALTLGARVYNPLRQEVTADERLPTVFQAGLAYSPSPRLLLALEAEKDIDFPTRVRSGVEYRIADPLALRLGVVTQPVSLSFGLGLQLKNRIGLDFASNYHQYLGFSPAFGLTYGGREKQ